MLAGPLVTRRISHDHHHSVGGHDAAAPGVEFEVDEAQLVAVSFLVRYSGRTLEASSSPDAALWFDFAIADTPQQPPFRARATPQYHQ